MQKLCKNAALARETIGWILRPPAWMGGNMRLCGKFEIFPYLHLEAGRWRLSAFFFFLIGDMV